MEKKEHIFNFTSAKIKEFSQGSLTVIAVKDENTIAFGNKNGILGLINDGSLQLKKALCDKFPTCCFYDIQYRRKDDKFYTFDSKLHVIYSFSAKSKKLELSKFTSLFGGYGCCYEGMAIRISRDEKYMVVNENDRYFTVIDFSTKSKFCLGNNGKIPKQLTSALFKSPACLSQNKILGLDPSGKGFLFHIEPRRRKNLSKIAVNLHSRILSVKADKNRDRCYISGNDHLKNIIVIDVKINGIEIIYNVNVFNDTSQSSFYCINYFNDEEDEDKVYIIGIPTSNSISYCEINGNCGMKEVFSNKMEAIKNIVSAESDGKYLFFIGSNGDLIKLGPLNRPLIVDGGED